jgi:hypothetical protein
MKTAIKAWPSSNIYIHSTNVIQRREEGAGMSDPASTRLSFVSRGPRGGALIQFIIRPSDFIAPPGDEDQDETAIQGVTKVPLIRTALLRIRIRIRIQMFLGPLDPDPVVRCMDSVPAPDPDTSITKQK